MSNAPIDVKTLPEATHYLNYPRTGPPVGSYLGPNRLGEYFTVVSNEPGKRHLRGVSHHVGVAKGIYTVNGVPTDPDGLPTDAIVAMLQADHAQWQAHRTPPLLGHRPMIMPVINDPSDHITVTDT